MSRPDVSELTASISKGLCMSTTRREFLTTLAAGAAVLSTGSRWSWGQATQPADPPLRRPDAELASEPPADFSS